MKLNYIVTPSDLGGTAVSGCGTIHKSEIKDTLTKLSKDLDLPFDLNDYTLGSTGKREYSGDIDLVIDTMWWLEGPGAFREKLAEKFSLESTSRHGDLISLRYLIVGYKENLQEAQPRTGYVQIDFNFGDVLWEKFYHYSPGDQSAYKGGHRNLAIAAISAIVGVTDSILKDDKGRPQQQIRWKYSPKGFIKVNRRCLLDERTGNWMKKQHDTILEVLHDPDKIAKALFLDDNASEEDLVSLETIMEAVDKYCGLVEKERIYRRMASNFGDWNQGKLFKYPPEIEAYFQRNDK